MVSSRAQIAPFLAMDILTKANAMEAAGRTVYHLETGQPATPAPRPALDAAAIALKSAALGYTEALGQPALKKAISAHYAASYGLEVDPRRVIVTTGSSAGFILSFLAAFDPGDGLAMATPGYPAYRNTALALSIRPQLIAAGAAEHFQLPSTALARVENAKGLLIASPGNPTGTVIPPDQLKVTADLCAERKWRLISDEIYHGLTYGVEAPCVLRYAPDAIVINSFSKYFSMTGWRVGWMIVPEDLVRPIERLAQNLYISPPALSQIAATAALSSAARAELNGHVATYRQNRDVLIAALGEGGVQRMAPADGAFYLYADVSGHCDQSSDLAQRLLDDTGVATTPGWDFDPDGGGAWLRLSYAGSSDTIRAAAKLLTPWLAHQKRF